LAEAKKNKEEAGRLDQDAISELRKNVKTERGELTIRAKDQKLVGGIYFNPPSLKEINKEHEGQGGIGVFSSYFVKTAKDEVVKDEPMNTNQE